MSSLTINVSILSLLVVIRKYFVTCWPHKYTLLIADIGRDYFRGISNLVVVIGLENDVMVLASKDL